MQSCLIRLLKLQCLRQERWILASENWDVWGCKSANPVPVVVHWCNLRQLLHSPFEIQKWLKDDPFGSSSWVRVCTCVCLSVRERWRQLSSWSRVVVKITYCWHLICPLLHVSAPLDTIKLRHLRLSEEETNSCGLCVANMLPMDFETRNMGKNWKKKTEEENNILIFPGCETEKWSTC